MCDNTFYTLQSSFFLWALSLLPISIVHYVLLALVCASVLVYAAHYNLPSTRLTRLNNSLAAATDILARAKAECLRDHLALVATEGRLIQAQVLTSEIKTRLLEAHDAPWKVYLHAIWQISHSLTKCERQVGWIQTSTLLIIETEHRRKLAEDLNTSRGAVNAVLQVQGHRLNGGFNQVEPSQGIYSV